MKELFFFMTMLLTTSLFAQQPVYWTGGTPGKTTQWDEPKNWSNHKVPDEFSNVIIPDVSSTTRAYPVVEQQMVSVNTIFIYTNAKVTIEENAKLMVIEGLGVASLNRIETDGLLLVYDNSVEDYQVVSSRANNKTVE